jgi:dihydrofolate reductase
MKISTHISVSADGYVCGEDGRPAVLSVPTFAGATTLGFPEFLANVDAVVMGRTTFLPALDAPSWPWEDRQVFVLTRRPLPDSTPSHVRSAADPAELVTTMRSAGFAGDVHLVGGPETIRSFAAVGALDRLEIIALPLLLGTGLPLSTPGTPFTRLSLQSHRILEGGCIELSYAFA